MKFLERLYSKIKYLNLKTCRDDTLKTDKENYFEYELGQSD